MTDRKVTVNEADLRWVLSYVRSARGAQGDRLRAALDALGPELCEHEWQDPFGETNWCEGTAGHHGDHRATWLSPEPCGHPSADGWNIGRGRRLAAFRCEAPTGHHTYRGGGPWGPEPCCKVVSTDDPIHCGDAHQAHAEVWS